MTLLRTERKSRADLYWPRELASYRTSMAFRVFHVMHRASRSANFMGQTTAERDFKGHMHAELKISCDLLGVSGLGGTSTKP